jgi:hypothetical protein
VITVIGIWEPGYTFEQMFIEETIWNQTLSAFGVDRFIMVCGPHQEKPAQTSPEECSSMQEALDVSVGEKVFLTFPSEGATSLKDFTHPENAVYIFGCPGENLLSYIQPEDHQVHIFTHNDVDMLACSCVAAVLYDRL